MPIQKWSDHIWVARLGDEPGFAEDLDQLLDKAPAATPTPHLILDLNNVTHLNSSNLSHLLRVRKLAIDLGTRLRLAGPSDRTWALFLSTGLDKVFDFRADTATALADLQIDP